MPQRILWARLQSGIEAQPLGHFLNCVGAQFTCPDCTSMTATEVKGAECEVRSDDGVTVTLSAPPIGEDAIYTPAAATSIDNCVVSFLLLILSRAWPTSVLQYEYGWQRKTCRSCSLRGTCDHPTGQCICEPMFSNFDCSYKACPHATCNGGGKCLLSGSCVCEYARFAIDCSISFGCPDECSMKGICEPNGLCRCYAGYIGDSCAITVSVSSAHKLLGPAYGLQSFSALMGLALMISWS